MKTGYETALLSLQGGNDTVHKKNTKQGAYTMGSEKRDFDKVASSWDEEPRRVKLAGDIARTISREAGLSPDLDVLDYGCGTGLVTLHIQPYVRSITGADTSQGMLDVLRRKTSEAGLSNVRTTLIDLSEKVPVQGKFHLIVSSMTLHHIEDIQALFNNFYHLLLPGGRLCVADLDTEDGSFHSDTTGVVHFGFDRGRIENMLNYAGFTDIRDVTASVIVKEASDKACREYPVFLMIADK
jgi:ubiquinone/menaquinone biosynthesis C-methylase UbiE